MGEFGGDVGRLWGDVLERLGGVEAEFMPLAGEAVKIGVLKTESMQMKPSGMSQTWVQVIQIEYSLADLSREAVVGESFRVNGIEYKVGAVTENDGYVVKVVVHEP